MADLTPGLVDDVIKACRGAADQIGAALSRALDGEFVGITIGEGATYDAGAAPAGCDGSGLVVVLQYGAAAAVALLPESSGLLPEWYADPDPTGQSKLSTLAQELSVLAVPDSLAADDFHAFRVDHLADALARAELADDAVLLPMSLKCDEKQGQLSLIWPVAKPAAIRPDAGAAGTLQSADDEQATPATDAASGDGAGASNFPQHTRSLFKVRVPVSVNLAAQKLSVDDILELVPGTIIKFEKSCDELLDLMVGDRPIAAGEVVKIGDKFGLRIRNMVEPDERFVTIKATLAG